MSGTMLTNPFRFGGGPYAANGVNFDGTNDYLTRGADLTGNADGKKGIFYCRFKIDGGNGTELTFYSKEETGRFRIFRTSTNLIEVNGRTTSNSTILRFKTVATHQSGAGWKSILASWDMAVSNSGRLYINDSSDYSQNTFTDDTLDYQAAEHGIGARSGGGQNWNGCLADFYFNNEEYLDFNTVSNRRKFTDASDNPVDLGSDGSTPTGNIPRIYFSGVTSTWHTNNGSGGGFTENGALTDCADSP